MLEQLDTVIAFATVMLMLSLLVTTVVQMAISVSNLRGKCLLEGTEQLLTQLYPDLKGQAHAIAKKVLTHSAIGERAASLRDLLPERFRAVVRLPTNLAVAIRPEELILVLKELAEDGTAFDPATRESIKTLFNSTPGKGSPEMVAKAEELLKKLEGQFPNQAQDLKNAVENVLGSTQSIVVKVDAWFDTVMDRTSEIFKYYTRQVTVVVAVLLALLLHVDSLAILDQLSQDEDLRARLVQMNDTAQESAKKVIAMEDQPLATQAIQNLARDEKQPEVMKTVAALCAQPDVNLCFAGLKMRQDGETWLNKSLPEPKQRVLEAYEKEFTVVTQAHLKSLGQSFQELQDHLAETQLAIVPEPIPWPWQFKSWRNLFGVVMTAFFLSLGAPFWYNALRKLSDLRPIVARRVDGDQGTPKKRS
jgi:hypothetical protein